MTSHDEPPTNPAPPPEPGPPSAPGDSDRWARIDAYLTGELSPQEIAALEQAMAADPALARDVAQWREALAAARDWAQADPPGLARADAVTLESLGPHRLPEFARSVADTPTRPAQSQESPRSFGSFRSFRSFSPRVWRLAAAAALALGGFALGRLTQAPPSSSERPAPPTVAIGTPPAPQPIVAPALAATPRPATSPAPPGTDVAMPRPPARATDERGRVIVETSLHASGGQAVWVIDGGFQVAQTRSAIAPGR